MPYFACSSNTPSGGGGGGSSLPSEINLYPFPNFCQKRYYTDDYYQYSFDYEFLKLISKIKVKGRMYSSMSCTSKFYMNFFGVKTSNSKICYYHPTQKNWIESNYTFNPSDTSTNVNSPGALYVVEGTDRSGVLVDIEFDVEEMLTKAENDGIDLSKNFLARDSYKSISPLSIAYSYMQTSTNSTYKQFGFSVNPTKSYTAVADSNAVILANEPQVKLIMKQ